ncbi:5'-3' exonuclease H3TH domain-containing protein [Chloroflexota bacterium]
MIKLENLLIVDGHNLLFQMFYGMPSRIIGRNGKAIQAVVGFTGALLKVIKNIQASYVVVLFDGEKGGYRVDENIEYKGNRKDYTDAADDDNPFLQLVDIKRVLDYLEIKNYEIVERVETDDVVASYVAKLKENYNIYILSTDTDFMQLVDNNVRVFIYRGKKTIVYDIDAVISKYGIAPQYFADYKSLAGDSSDNITGIRGIGQKTAKKLIDKFGHIEDIIKNVDLIENDSIRSSIKDNVEVLFANIRLIKLSQITETPFEIEALHINNYDNYKTMEILKDIELI